jgi:O-antigen/teichoic acid export membrane protein
VRAAYQVALIWSALLTLVMVGLALTAPIASQRGEALLVLSPSMIFNGLNPARVLFIVRYRTRSLVSVDASIAVIQMVASIVLAAAGLGPVAVAAVVSAGSILDNIVITVMARRMLPADEERFSRLELIRRSAPLGIMSIMTKVYLTIDLVLLGWYVAGSRLGNYAAASKLLTVVAGFAGVVMSGALPGLASIAQDRERRHALVERIWHWLIVGAVPLFIGLELFAPLTVRLALGERYGGAVALIRILSVAGVVTVGSNLVGNLMVALHRTRQLLIQSSAAITVNIGANVILIPRYGVYAAAWITLVTEVVVCSCGLFSLRHDLPWLRLSRISAGPALAILVSSLIAVPLLNSQWLALALAGPAFVCTLLVFKAWPAEFRLPPRIFSRSDRTQP